jgi:hypothetical protein
MLRTTNDCLGLFCEISPDMLENNYSISNKTEKLKQSPNKFNVIANVNHPSTHH